ncbi:MAG: hypothetical protein C7B46_08325 [Sulfobacillus benefaciens]|uniref:DUF3558 domain-containing protein n=1 Tax=Sulfobacillus benefaciens TaxID=453960 RepID=A0A2T2XHC8_9FIRM|nr:MAG: hypothetical protein C7B46_08325 [Sulfobacillus benefaciens]
MQKILAIVAITVGVGALAGCGTNNASPTHQSSPSKPSQASSSSASVNSSSAVTTQSATVEACSLISRSQVAQIMSLPMGSGHQQPAAQGGTQCSYQTTTKSLTGGIGSNMQIALYPTTQSYTQFKSILQVEGNPFGFYQVKVDGIPVLISKSGAQSSTVVGHFELTLDLINTVNANYDKPEVLAALKICLENLQNS